MSSMKSTMRALEEAAQNGTLQPQFPSAVRAVEETLRTKAPEEIAASRAGIGASDQPAPPVDREG